MSKLQRRLGVPGAVVIGLAAMLGAGVFYVWTPAAELAGKWLWVALLLAAAVAVCNAFSTAQLAMEHPVSGGGYAFGRAEVSPTAGFVAGWMFLTGKTCSAAAIAMIAGQHLWPSLQVPVAIAVIVVLATLNATGVRTTARVSSIILAIVLAALVFVLVWKLAGGAFLDATASQVMFGAELHGPFSVLQAAGLLFFAFAGYARMATLGEEVRNPRRSLPVAILAGLGLVLVIYGLIAWAVADTYSGGTVPKFPVADLVADPIGRLVVVVAGAIACLGSLMGILAGLSRTSLAMARDGELPGPLARISTRTHAPVVAEIVMAAFAILLVLWLPPVTLVGLSSTAVLTYYAVGHVAMLRMRRRGVGWLPAWVAVAGLVLCTVLVLTLPWQGILAAAVWLALALAIRAARPAPS